MAVAVTMAAPAVSDEDPPPCLYLPTLVELLMRDQPPSRALCSFLAMFWFWSDCEAEEKELLLGAVLLGLLRFLKAKMACLVLDLLSCFSCHSGAKGDKQPVTMSVPGGVLGMELITFCVILLRFRWRCRGESALSYRSGPVRGGCRPAAN